ncbi:DapH/DapD/GlmU-related protein [Notoacmeibacter sp. MSK16QG-6]|uniref:acyltransferase n=1 Tax=Notoacmeibacter sp. MSK16QG-6 TaxID=2957982 RepID=UPI0020A05DD3|nr:acyltransferase [Notoacmeibacter sp. MSK16QG-6]MCP1198064.1 acyltransferase [Notoacmeibacter sp. MSK16QG-6]
MRRMILRMGRRFLRLLMRPVFGLEQLGPIVALRTLFFQKFLRINGHVPWPVHPSTHIKAPKKIVRGTRFPGLSAGCHIDGRNGIEFGRNVWVGPNVAIISMNHDMLDFRRYEAADPIRIGDNSWLGIRTVILPGVVLGPHTVVAAGAVVTQSFPEGDQVLGGVPARVIRKLEPYHGASE